MLEKNSEYHEDDLGINTTDAQKLEQSRFPPKLPARRVSEFGRFQMLEKDFESHEEDLVESIDDFVDQGINTMNPANAGITTDLSKGGGSARRHGSCIIILKNEEGILLCCDSIEVEAARTFIGVDKLRKYGDCYAVCCGTPSHYDVVDDELKTLTDDRRVQGLPLLTAQELATRTYQLCQLTPARPALDCHFFFASIDPNPQWVSYGPVGSQQPRLLPFAWRAGAYGAFPVDTNSWWCEGSSSHLAEDFLNGKYKTKMNLSKCIGLLCRAEIAASAMPCTGHKIRIEKLTVVKGWETAVHKDVKVLQAEMM